MVAFIILGIIFLVILIVWVGGFLYANDYNVPSKSLNKFKRALIIFPHADDELLTCGGFIKKLISLSTEVNWVILSRGERGTPDAHLDTSLKEIRSLEAKKAATIYGVNNLIIKNYPDNSIESHEKELIKEVKNIILHINPDLIITYDTAGLYGHPDHIVTSKVVTDLIKNNFPKIELWYVAYPKRIMRTLKLPTHMADDYVFTKRQTLPNIRIFVGFKGIITKIKAAKQYKSQITSIINSFPIKQIPIQFYISIALYEYFYKEN
jgi:LmbE family N-acetylglucosaminyl deacetylase